MTIKILGGEVNTATFGPETFNPNTGINASSWISIAAQKFTNGQLVLYTLSAGNTLPTGLTSGQTYFSVYANSTGLALSNSLGGANIAISNSGKSETGHTLFSANGLGASQVRVFNLGAANILHISNSSGVEIGNLTITNSEVMYLQKSSATDTVWTVNSSVIMFASPVSVYG